MTGLLLCAAVLSLSAPENGAFVPLMAEAKKAFYAQDCAQILADAGSPDRRTARHLGDSHAVRATPSGIELYRRNGDGDYVLVERTKEVASCIASEGDWLVAFIPDRNAIYRYRLKQAGL